MKTVYALYDWGNRVELESAEVEKITAKQVRLKDRAGLAFGCASTLDISRADYTIADAVSRFVARRMEKIEDARQEIADAEKAIERARRLIKEVA